MKIKTPKKERAAAPTTAPTNKYRNGSYLRAESLSSDLKQKIGELLFCLEFPIEKELLQVGWGLFETFLTQYIEVKHQGDGQ